MSGEGYERELVNEAFDSNWIAPLGPQVDAFEREFADYIGCGYAAALSSGTAALHLVLQILGIGAGDEVFCSSFTFAATAFPIAYQNAEPVFIDSEPESWNIDPEILDSELRRCAGKGKLPKAVIAVDLYGQSANWEPIVESCRNYGVPLLEDAAEALGADYNGVKTGNFGLAGIFSFNGNKIITTSGGGMLVSDDEELIKKARFLSTQARDPASHYQHSQIGFNYRMSNILAAVGRGQIKVIEERIERRREIFDYYVQALSSLPGVEFMPEPDYGRSTRWLTCITVAPDKFGANCEGIRLKLEEHNIESRPLWKPMHLQPVFKDCRVCGGGVSERLFKDGLCLPSGTALTEADLEHICGLIRSLHK